MTIGPKPGQESTPLHLTYDAWNRLVKASQDSGGSEGAPIALYRLDGLGRRIAKVVATQTSGHWDRTDYYYNESWQCLEERKSLNQTDTSAVATTVYAQYLWDIRYIDAPVCRWRSTQVNGTLDECLYYCNDANMNVTALVNASDGGVVERYQYTPYGQVTVCDSAWTRSAERFRLRQPDPLLRLPVRPGDGAVRPAEPDVPPDDGKVGAEGSGRVCQWFQLVPIYQLAANDSG